MTGLTARGLVDVATSACPRVTHLAAAGTTPAAAARTLYAQPPPSASTFALAEGLRFERRLTSDGAAALASLYQEDFPTPITVLDLDGDIRESDGPRLFATAVTALFGHINGHPGPALLLQAPLKLAVSGRVEILRPDLLIQDGRGWRVGEIKAYLDLDGQTDGRKIKSAVLQAAVSVVALRELLLEHGRDAEEAAALIPSRIDLVLQRPQWSQAARRTLSAEAEIEQISASLSQLRGHDVTTAPDTQTVNALPHVYSASCEGRCALAGVCGEQARAADPDRLFVGGPGVALLDLADISGAQALRIARRQSEPEPAARALARALRAGYASAIPAGPHPDTT